MAVLSRTRYNICYNTLVIGRRDYREILCTLEVERSSAGRPLTDMRRPIEDRRIKMTDFPPHFYSMTVIHQLGNNNLHFYKSLYTKRGKYFGLEKPF